MGEVAKPKAGKLLLTILIISFFVVCLPQAAPQFAPSTTNGRDLGYPDEGGIVSDLSSPFDPAGPPRPVVEFAIGTRSGQTVSLPSSPNAYIDLDADWVGNAASIFVINLWDNRNHAVNGTFDSGSGTSSPPWSFSKYDPLSHAAFSGTWVQNSPQSGNKTVQCQMPLPSGSITFNGNERVSWNETILPFRGTVLSARLVFNWWPVVATGFTRSEFVFYGTVNNTRLVGVGTPFPWEANLKDVASNPAVNNHWNLANFSVPTSAFNLPSQKISIQIGIMYKSGAATYTGWNTQNIMYIDNVKLVLQAYALPHNINLKVKPSGGSNSTVSDSGGYGNGAVKMTGLTASGTSFPFIFGGGNLTAPDSAGFTASVALNATKQTSATSTFESHGSGENVSWSFWFRTSFYTSSQSVGSTVFAKYYFNISAPSNWDYTTCIDPDQGSHTIATDPSFSTSVVGSNKVLTVNVTRIGSYSRSQNSFSPYQINAESDNYVKEVFTQKYVTGQWQNASSFKPNDYMRVVGYIASPTGVRANSGTANMSSWYGTPATTWKPLNQTTPINGLANFTFPITNNIAFASNYTVEVAWLNQTSGQPQAGVATAVFQVIRDAQINSYVPVEDQLIAQNELFRISIVLVDKIDQTAIPDAVAQYRVAWEGSAQSMAWNSLGNNYTADERIPTTAHGVYWINITATKSYYTPLSLNISIYVTYATQATPQNQYQVIQWGTVWFNFTSTYYRIYPASAPITGATISCQTPFWQNRTLFKESQTTNGSYEVSLLTQGITENTYSINFLIWNAVPDYQPQIIYLTLIVTPIPTSSLGSFIPTDQGDLVADSLTVSSGETAMMLFSYTDTVGSGITGASLTYTADFGSGSLFEVTGRPGYYMLNITTGSIQAAAHGITVTAQKAHYATQTKAVTVTITTPGLPVWLLVGGSLGSAGMVVIVFISYWYIRRARIPFIIKKIDESLKLIGKGDHEAATPVALRSREELVVGITQERIDVFGRRPSGPEAGEGVAEAAAAPTPETTALKKELEAVEPKLKSGEVIEEVEMDTLDEELQKLEKFEDKEKLPDGAKEVRDVVEKYKQSKKKKD